MRREGEYKPAREDVAPTGGPAMAVICSEVGCARAALLDPREVFGARRDWPLAGPSSRFRCRCGGRRAVISYPKRPVDQYGPIDRVSLALWY